MHWINVVCLTVLLMSGLNIFNAHPALYWGRESTFADPWISFGARNTPAGPVGVHAHRRLRVRRPPASSACRTSPDSDAAMARAFPWWATIPGAQWLAMARHWHFFFAWIFVINGVLYVLYSDLQPAPDDATSCRRARSCATSAARSSTTCKFKHPTGDGGDALQRAAEPDLPDRHLRLAAAGGDRRAGDVAAPRRRLHRLGRPPRRPAVGANAALPRRLRPACCSSLVHVAEVFIAGVWNEMRSMITGWYALPDDHAKKEAQPMKKTFTLMRARQRDRRTCCAAPSPPPVRRCSPAATGCRGTSRSSRS